MGRRFKGVLGDRNCWTNTTAQPGIDLSIPIKVWVAETKCCVNSLNLYCFVLSCKDGYWFHCSWISNSPAHTHTLTNVHSLSIHTITHHWAPEETRSERWIKRKRHQIISNHNFFLFFFFSQCELISKFQKDNPLWVADWNLFSEV